MYDFDKPFMFHIELTDKCNARCVQCPRNIIEEGELKENPKLHKVEITLNQYKSIFKNYQKKTNRVSFSGNMGDPVFAKDIFDITDYTITNVLGDDGKFCNNTNGGLRPKEWWSEYGKLLKGKKHLVNFAIDGLEDTHHLYRVNTRYERVIENAKAFIEAGGRAGWSFIRFGHNQHQEEEVRARAKKFGFKNFNAINTQRFGNLEKINYKFKGKKYTISRYNPKNEKPQVLSTLDVTKKNWGGKHINSMTADEINIRIQKSVDNFTKSDDTMMQYAGSIQCYTQKRNEVYIDCLGHVHPCCWISSSTEENLGNLHQRDYKKAWNFDFQDILQEDYFEHILPLSWEVKPCLTCVTSCGKDKFITVKQINKVS